MKKAIFLVIIFICSVALFANDDLIGLDDLDSIFGEDSRSEDEKEESDTNNQDNAALDMLFTPGISIGGNYQIFAGAGFGIINPDWKGTNTPSEWKNTGLFGLKSTLSLNADISKDLRILQKWQYKFPEYDFLLKEFFADSAFQDSVLFRVGVQNINWSESRNFKHTNLPSRMTDGFFDDSWKRLTYAVKVDIPIDIGGIQLIALTKPGFWDTANNPEFEEIGYGIKGNIILKFTDTSFDINSGYYYHKQLNHRGFISVSGTVFENWEVYAEGLIALNPTFTNYYWDENGDPVTANDFDPATGFADNYLDISFNIGAYSDSFDGKFKYGAEYYYNGEETEIEESSLYHGHNMAIYTAYNFDFGQVSLRGKVHSDELTGVSALLVPALVVDLNKNLKLSLATPVILGGDKGVYVKNNPDDFNREAAAVFRIIFHGKI